MDFGDGTHATFGRLSRLHLLTMAAAILLACPFPAAAQRAGGEPGTLAEARKTFKTTLQRKVSAKDVPPKPPQGVFDLIHYTSPAGKLAAYLTPDPKDGAKRPAMVWITGGTCNTIGDVWSEAPSENDQTAAAYREAGIVMMFPSLRGGNEGRGFQEGFYGEVDDVIAAADHLAKLPYVDPARIYLGGHSTGGTLALLVAQCSNRFRAVISFGPVGSVLGYQRGGIELPFSTTDPREMRLRSPVFWMDRVQAPTWVFEGLDQPGNAGDLDMLARRSGDSKVVRCVGVKGVDHFSILAPANKVLAKKILADTGAQPSLDLTPEDLNAISPGAGDTGAANAPQRPRPPAPRARPGASRQGEGGGIEWLPLVGAKGEKTSQTAIASTDRMSGLLFELSNAGQIRRVAPATLRQTPPRENKNQKVVRARPGYVLYGVHVDAKETVNAIRLVFVRLGDDDRIAPEDTYESDWIGTPTGDKPVTLGCDGKQVVGLTTSVRGEALSGFALGLTEEPAAE